MPSDEVRPIAMSEYSDHVHGSVRQRYARHATSQSCCGPNDNCDCSSPDLYPADLLATLPEDVASFTLGCGNPIDLARLSPGEVVLDLGSGGGLDCFFASRLVGEGGQVIGVDMTPEMIERARLNAGRLSVKNVEFRQGFLEALPVEDASIDVVISNCVINLSPDKSRVFAEIGRVLKPGGRLAVSDVVSNGPVPDALREDVDAWGACLGGALDFREFERGLLEAGLTDVVITARDSAAGPVSSAPSGVPFSALIRARKPNMPS
jgi:SAM-dependent methyltransferase